MKELSDHIRQISRVIIPKSDSRLNNKVLIFKEDFRKTASEAIEMAFYDKGICDSMKEQKKVITAFNNIADGVGCQKWKEFESINKVNYIVAPNDYIDELNIQLQINTATAIKY